MCQHHAAPVHSCKYRWLRAPATTFELSADNWLTIGRSSRGAAAPRSSVQALFCLLPAITAAILMLKSPRMPTITFDVPEGALSALRLSPTEFVREMRLAAALLWYSQGDISQSKAAEIAGTSRAKFIDELAHRHIPVVQVTPEELQDEIHRE